MANNGSDREIAEAFLAGDRVAAGYLESCINAAFSRWRSRFGHETDDIISDIWFKVFQSLRRGEFRFQSKLSTFIKPIVDHTCIDYYRFRQRVKPVDIYSVDIADDRISEEEKLEKQQDAKLTFRVLRLIRRECIQLWRMQLKQRMTCRQIGEIHGKTEANIRRRLWACRESARKIREKLLKKSKRF